MSSLPLIFEQCRPRLEILAGELPDAIFAADLWDVIAGKAHKDYLNPRRFFSGTHPTENLKLLLKEVTERLAGIEGGAPVFRLETGFGGGKTHGLIAAVHAAVHGEKISEILNGYDIQRFPASGSVRVAAFVGEESDPLNGARHQIDGKSVTTFTPWGQIGLLSGGRKGYEMVRESDINGVAPSRGRLEEALGDHPLLILIDELVLYMAKTYALPEDHQRRKIGTQWATFLQTLFSIAVRRPRTSLILTLPSEQDANRKLTEELKQHMPSVLETVDEVEKTSGRHARNLTPTQAHDRAAVLGRRLFESVDDSRAEDIARAYTAYYEAQRTTGARIDGKAFGSEYIGQISSGYPFHPELIRLFAERLADIPEFQATRGALRLVGRIIRNAWANKDVLHDAFLLQSHHVDLSNGELRDEILKRLGKGAFERGLEADVMRTEGETHASQVEGGWPWRAATESSLVAFLHSLPDGSKGVTPWEVSLGIGRPGCDLAYVARGMEETERLGWYMRREGDHYLFRTRASVNKRFQERLSQIQPAEARETLDGWIQDIYSGFTALKILLFPKDHTAIPDTTERIRLAVIHYDTECGAVGGGHRLNFVKSLFTRTGVKDSPRRYRNNILFLLAEEAKITNLKDAVRALIAWERVRADIENEQLNHARSAGADYRTLKDAAKRGASGIPPEFIVLENDLGEVLEKLGAQELNVRTRLLDAYRVLVFPSGGGLDPGPLFEGLKTGPTLECYRVDLGERPDGPMRGRRTARRSVAEGPILQCLRENNKLLDEPSEENPLSLAPQILRDAPLWKPDEKRISTAEIWDRLRSEPELPMALKETDLFPTFRAGLTAEPEALWCYYNQSEKKIYIRDNAADLSPIIDEHCFLYDIPSAIQDRIIPVNSIPANEIWVHLWDKEGSTHAPTVTMKRLMEAASGSAHFPVLPKTGVLWRGMADGTRENRWILYLRGPNLAVGAREMAEFPSSPRLDESAEFWTYQAALDAEIYPRDDDNGVKIPLNPENIKKRCWEKGREEIPSTELERFARGVWKDVSRPLFESMLQKGVVDGVWNAWRKESPETFYTVNDKPTPIIHVGDGWALAAPSSPLSKRLDTLRPGRGPQPVKHAGTPREALVKAWDELSVFKDARVDEIAITVEDRNTLDNTLIATWSNRPDSARVHVSINASGQRDIQGKQEKVDLSFEGRFEEIRGMLSPVWPFHQQGDLDISITTTFTFDPPIRLDDGKLEAYRAELMNANQGDIEIRVTPRRSAAVGGGA